MVQSLEQNPHALKRLSLDSPGRTRAKRGTAVACFIVDEFTLISGSIRVP